MVANAVVAVACLVFVVLIVVPLRRLHQLRTNRLAVAAVVLFFGFGVQRALQIAYQLVGLLGAQGKAFAAAQRNTWWLAMVQVLLAGAAVYFVVHRRSYARLLLHALLFDSFAQRQRMQSLEAQQVVNAARQAAEGERDANAAMLAAVIENSQALISVKQLDGRYLLVNGAFEQTFDRDGSALVGSTDSVFGPAVESLWLAGDRAARQGLLEFEEWVDTPAGRRLFETAKFPLRDAAGQVYATCGIAVDVTEQRGAAAAVSQARDAAVEANVAKSAFLATMSHEIRTPMNAVIGMTDLLLHSLLDDEQRVFAATIRSSGEALLAVINDILDFSKIEAGELHLESAGFNLRDEVENCLDVVAAAAAGKDLDLLCYVEESCPAWVCGDSVRVRQILTNLLSNAVKFTHHGQVLVTANAVTIPGNRVALTLSVTDTGIGISADGLQRLFTSFSQADASTTRVYGGTGLGLTISQRLAHAMGGDLSVTSTPGIGSCFTCTLSLDVPVDIPDGLPVDGLSVAEAAAVLAGTAVLIVDDNDTNLTILNAQLSHLGMICTPVNQPEDALYLVNRGYRYDVAVLDMHMPQLDGLQLGAALKQHTSVAAAPLILLTSLGWRPTGFEQSFAALLTKPAKSSALRQTLVKLLSGPPDDPAPTHTSWDPADGSLRPLKVLLAEDNPVNQLVAKLMLDKLGHTVDIVATGTAAVVAVERTRYDVILMDVQMPEMDGLQATREILARHLDRHHPPIVAMTASALIEDRDACTAAGMDSYLSKPVRARDLQTILTSVTAAH